MRCNSSHEGSGESGTGSGEGVGSSVGSGVAGGVGVGASVGSGVGVPDASADGETEVSGGVSDSKTAGTAAPQAQSASSAAVISTMDKSFFMQRRDQPTMSPPSKGSPHSGQNFGGCVGSAGSQPHLSHLYCGTPAGFFAPHSEQNLPLFTAPQEHVQVFAAAGSGFFVPQEEQSTAAVAARPSGRDSAR